MGGGLCCTLLLYPTEEIPPHYKITTSQHKISKRGGGEVHTLIHFRTSQHSINLSTTLLFMKTVKKLTIMLEINGEKHGNVKCLTYS